MKEMRTLLRGNNCLVICVDFSQSDTKSLQVLT